MQNNTTHTDYLRAKVTTVADKIEALYTVGQKTGLDVNPAIRKELESIPRGLHVHVLRLIAGRKADEAKYSVTERVLSTRSA